MSKRHFQSPKTNKKCQIYVPTDHKVKWAILKSTKIRDQGMELAFFEVRFKICLRGLAFKLRGRFFCFFKNSTFW